MKNSSEKEFPGEKTEFLDLLLDVPLASRLVLEDLNLPVWSIVSVLETSVGFQLPNCSALMLSWGYGAVFMGLGLSCHPEQ